MRKVPPSQWLFQNEIWFVHVQSQLKYEQQNWAQSWFCQHTWFDTVLFTFLSPGLELLDALYENNTHQWQFNLTVYCNYRTDFRLREGMLPYCSIAYLKNENEHLVGSELYAGDNILWALKDALNAVEYLQYWMGLHREPTVKKLHQAQAKDMEKTVSLQRSWSKSHIHPPWTTQDYLSELEHTNYGWKESKVPQEMRNAKIQRGDHGIFPAVLLGTSLLIELHRWASKNLPRVCIESCAMNNDLLFISSNHFLAV